MMSQSAERTRHAPHPLLLFLGLLVVVLAAASFLVRRIPIDAFKPRIEAAFGRATGRRLTIDGPLRLTLLPAPGLEADDVSIANLPGGSRPVMAHVASLQADVALLPLLGGAVRVETLSLDQPEILLERLPDGTPNWRFSPARPAKGPAAPGPTRPHRFDFSVQSVDGSGGVLAWRDPRGLGTGAVTLHTFHAGAEDRQHPVTVYAQGDHGTAPFSLSLASASLAALAASDDGATLPIRANLVIGRGQDADHVALDGTFRNGPHLRGFDGTVRATVPQLASLNALLPHASLPQAADIELRAELVSDAGGHEVVRALDLSGGAADLGVLRPGLALARFAIGARAEDAPLSVNAAGTIDGAPFTVASTDAGTLALWSNPRGSAPVSGSVTVGRSRITLDGALTRLGPGAAGRVAGQADIVLDDPGRLASLAGPALAARLGQWHEPVTFTGPVSLVRQPGHQAADGFAADLAATTWSLAGRAMPPMHLSGATAGDILTAALARPGQAPFATWREDLGRTPSPVALRLDGTGLPAGALLWIAARRGGLEGDLDVDATLSGLARGARLEPATLAGPIRASLVHATLDAALVRDVLGPVLDAAHAPTIALGRQQIRCAGLDGHFDAGTLALASLSLDSPFLALDGNGHVDLGRDTLALALTPVLRFGGVGASTTVAVTGPIDAPHAALAASGGRYALSIGHVGPASVACDGAPDIGPAPAAKAKPPRAIDILRGLGILR